ncbi:MAG: hypothetical protein EOO11_06185 [Chitinophagaceae bacterium]|nr:MAG: hypothetical protein EOO11_06185 [Chitinophagaceae bacterium]
MPNTNPRIPIPKDPESMLALAGDVHKKHEELGTASPLLAMEDFNWREVAPQLATATALQEQINDLENRLEILYQERNRHLPAIKGALASSRNLLKGVHAGNLKKLGDYGFTVDHTPLAKKKTIQG